MPLMNQDTKKPTCIRPHLKSRRGCSACKSRRVKCDEEKPSCGSCQRRDTECIYLAPAKRQSHRLQPCSSRRASLIRLDMTDAWSPESFTNISPEISGIPKYTPEHLLDIRLMHQYDSATIDALANALQFQAKVSETLRSQVPRLAFEHQFLMEALLFVSLIHLESTGTAKYGSQVAKYRHRAIRSLRTELLDVTENNHRAVFIASLLLGVTSIAADRITNYSGLWIINWLAMPMGPRALLQSFHFKATNRESYGSPPTIHIMGNVPTDPIPVAIPDALAAILHISEDNEDWEYQGDMIQATTGIGKLFGALKQPHLQDWIEFNVRSWAYTFISARFIRMARQGRPRALVIIAYYLVFLKVLPNEWLFEDVVHRDMHKLVGLLGPEWDQTMSIPKTAMSIVEKEEFMEYMARRVTIADSGCEDFLETTGLLKVELK